MPGCLSSGWELERPIHRDAVGVGVGVGVDPDIFFDPDTDTDPDPDEERETSEPTRGKPHP
jgi:hypothetical protein